MNKLDLRDNIIGNCRLRSVKQVLNIYMLLNLTSQQPCNTSNIISLILQGENWGLENLIDFLGHKVRIQSQKYLVENPFLNHYAGPRLTRREGEFWGFYLDICVNNDFINRDVKSYQFKESYINQNIKEEWGCKKRQYHKLGLWYIGFKVFVGHQRGA